jgi:enoyl-CoA hydratase/carnithine racemase
MRSYAVDGDDRMQLTTDHVLYEVDNGIAVIVLNRPESGNSISLEMHAGLREIWEEVRRDPEVRVAIVTGAGRRHLCTGADMRRAAAQGMTHAEGPMFEEVRLTARHCHVWKPVICAVNGLAAGGGLHFVVDADIVIAADHAQFLDTHVNVGQVVGIENIGLAKRLPLGTALRMTLVGRDYRLSTERAFQLGLVDEVVPGDELMDAAKAMALQIARNSPRAVSLSQQAVWNSLETSYAQSLEYGFSLVKLHRQHPDAAEGPRAFTERREPKWTP